MDHQPHCGKWEYTSEFKKTRTLTLIVVIYTDSFGPIVTEKKAEAMSKLLRTQSVNENLIGVYHLQTGIEWECAVTDRHM